MNRQRLQNTWPSSLPRPVKRKLIAAALTLLAPVAAMSLGGCGSSSPLGNGVPSPSENSVTVGTTVNSLPTPPAQSITNRYAGADLTQNGTSWNWAVSQPNGTYNYQQQQGVSSSNASVNSAGPYASFADFELFSDTLQLPYQFFGLNAEIASGVALFQPAFGGFPSAGLVVGVPAQPTSCLAPDGQLPIDFIAVPPQQGSATAATDTMYGQTALGYKNGQFTYTGTTQLAAGGAAASTATVPFAESYCVQAGGGYGIQSTAVLSGSASAATGSTTSNSIAYIGTTGIVVGTATSVTTVLSSGVTTSSNASTGFIGVAEPSGPIDLSKVTAGTYKGFNASTSVSQADPAYFGQGSALVATPTLTQTSTGLVGGFVDFFTFSFSPTPQPVTGNVLVDFGTQDAKHNGSFPNAAFTEPDPSNACPAAQQSTGTDGATYCTFPAVALIAESYGKFVIFIVGPEQPAGKQLFYVLVQD